MRRPGVITSGGGYSPQGEGGGGAPGGGESNVAGSRIRSGFSPADRSTSIRFFAAAKTPKARQAFSKSGRGSKESPMSPSSWSGGLSGLGDDQLDSWLGDRFKHVSRLWTPRRRRRPTPPPEPTPDHMPGIAGLDSWLSDRFKHADRKIIPTVRSVKTLVTHVGRVAVNTAAGAASGFVVGGPWGAAAGAAYGAGKGIYGVTSNAPVARTLYQTVGPALVVGAGAGYVATQGVFAPGAVLGSKVAAIPGGYAPAMSPLSLSTVPAAPTLSTAGYASPAAFGGTGTIFAPSYAPVAAPSLFAASSSFSPAVSAGLPLSGSGSLVAPAAGGVSAPAPAAGSSWLASTGKGLIKGTGEVFKAIGIGVGSQAVIAGMSKGGQAAQDYYASEFGAAAPAAESSYPAYAIAAPAGGPFGGGGPGGESSYPGEAPMLAGVSPIVGLALAGAALAIYMSRRKK